MSCCSRTSESGCKCSRRCKGLSSDFPTRTYFRIIAYCHSQTLSHSKALSGCNTDLFSCLERWWALRSCLHCCRWRDSFSLSFLIGGRRPLAILSLQILLDKTPCFFHKMESSLPCSRRQSSCWNSFPYHFLIQAARTLQQAVAICKQWKRLASWTCKFQVEKPKKWLDKDSKALVSRFYWEFGSLKHRNFNPRQAIFDQKWSIAMTSTGYISEGDRLS